MTDLPIADTLVSIPGGELFVRTWGEVAGSETSVPIVLLHDSLGSVDLWRGFPLALAQATGRRVIAYDRLGFGRSTPQTEPARSSFIDDEATVVFPALRAGLGLGAFVLFGHSVGGGMALSIAAAMPQACRLVISEAAQAFVEERTLDGIRAAEQSFEQAERFARLTIPHGERARWVLDAWTKVWLSPAFRDWSLDAVLPRVRCPVLAIHGDQDEFGSEAFPRRIVEGVAGPARLALMPGCGHVPHRERPAEILGVTAEFLKSFPPVAE